MTSNYICEVIGLGHKEELDKIFESMTGGKKTARKTLVWDETAFGKSMEVTEDVNHKLAMNFKAINDDLKRTATYFAHVIEENQLMIQALQDVAKAERLDWHTQQKAIAALHEIYVKRSEWE